jgi:hypothetical protein
MTACVAASVVPPGGTAPPSPQPVTEATRPAAALAVPQVFIITPVVAVFAAIPAPATGPSTTTAGGPALLTRRAAAGILES